MDDPNRLSLLTFAEAEAIGVAIYDRYMFHNLTPPMGRDDLGWAMLCNSPCARPMPPLLPDRHPN